MFDLSPKEDYRVKMPVSCLNNVILNLLLCYKILNCSISPGLRLKSLVVKKTDKYFFGKGYGVRPPMENSNNFF